MARRATRLLNGVGSFDPVSYVAATSLLIGCALIACWLPAREATRVDPIEALKVDQQGSPSCAGRQARSP